MCGLLLTSNLRAGTEGKGLVLVLSRRVNWEMRWGLPLGVVEAEGLIDW